MLCYVTINFCKIVLLIFFFHKNQFNSFMFRNVPCSRVFPFFRGVGGGGGCRGTFSLKLPRIRYQKTKIPIFEDF